MQYLLSNLTDYDVIRSGDSVICDLGADIPLMVFMGIATRHNCEMINITSIENFQSPHHQRMFHDTILFNPLQK